MDSQSNKRRMNVEVGDRLSDLSDDLIAKILSYNSIKLAVQTSVLTSRWKSIWTLVPYLDFSSEDFSSLRKFYKVFTHVISSCNDQVEISLNLRGKASQVFARRILDYAYSHNVQQLTFTFLYETQKFEFPHFLFSSQSLKQLTLIGPTTFYFNIMPISMWELPALTTLHLDPVTLNDDNTDKCVGIFSKFTHLQNLTLNNCHITGAKSFTICHPQLSSLTLKNNYSRNVVNVVTPHLKDLTIINASWEIRISAPNLTSLIYKNSLLKFSVEVDRMPSLKKLDLCVSYLWDAGINKVVDLLQKFRYVKFLTLSLEIIEFLSASFKLIMQQKSPFFNLRSLRICPESSLDPISKATKSTEVIKYYLLDNSPRATISMVSREEIRAASNAKSAQNLMAELRVLLDQEKAPTKSGVLTKNDKVEIRTLRRRKSSLTSDMSKRVAQQINLGGKKTIAIISLMERIKDLLVKLPTSKKAEISTCFSSLCVEADTVINNIVNCTKNDSQIRKVV